jgi:hypothetical protein
MRIEAADPRLTEAVLARWRATERDLDALGHDAAAADDLRALAAELKDEYERLIDEATDELGTTRRPPRH